MSTTREQEGGLWNESLGKIGATLKALQDAGLTAEDLKALRANDRLAWDVADLIIKRRVCSRTTDEVLRTDALLRFVMKDPWLYFSQADWMRYFDVWAGDTTTLGRFENTLLSIMESSCPFNPDRQLRDTHFVFCCYNTKRLHEKLAAALIRELKVSDSASTSEIRFSYGITDGLKCMLENYPGDQQLRWYALYRGGIPNSDQKNWDEQKAMIPEGYSVPSLWVAAQACMMHGFKQNPYFRQPGMRLSVGRVTDEIAPGNHLNVGTDFGINMKVGCNPRWFYDGDATRLPGVGIWAVREL